VVLRQVAVARLSTESSSTIKGCAADVIAVRDRHVRLPSAPCL
jgi:hypothetical protein